MPQLQRTEEERAQTPELQRQAGAGVFEDLWTSFFGGPGKPGAAMGIGVPGMNPTPMIQGFKGLGPVAMAPGTGLTGGKAAMLGDPIEALLQRIKSMSRRFGAQQEDMAQIGAEAVTRAMQQESMGGGQLARTARNAMLDEARKGINVGQRAEVSAIDKALNTRGNIGEFSLLAEVHKRFPNMTLDRFRTLRAGLGAKRTRSLEAPLGEGESRSLADVLRSTDDPLEVAMLNEKLGKLTEAQRTHLDEYLNGKPVDRKIVDRILKKLELRQKSSAKPIKGGAEMPPPNYEAAGPISPESMSRANNIAKFKQMMDEGYTGKPISGGAGDQFTNPDRPAFSTHSLYNVKQNLGADPVTGETPPAVSIRDMLGMSKEAKMGPGSEMFSGQPEYPPGTMPGRDWGAPEPIPLRTRPSMTGPGRVLSDPYGNEMADQNYGLMSQDTIKPGPYPAQNLSGFQQLQRMLMDALFKSSRN